MFGELGNKIKEKPSEQVLSKKDVRVYILTLLASHLRTHAPALIINLDSHFIALFILKNYLITAVLAILYY